MIKGDRAFESGAQPAERFGAFLRSTGGVVAGAVCYYVATWVAWALCLPETKVSLFFPPHALLVSVLLLVPTRRWWAYTVAAASAHFLATRQAHWPMLFALHCEVFDAVQNIGAAAGLRLLIKSPLKELTRRDAMNFILVAVILVPFGTAFWGAALTLFHGFGTHYWIEWRNLGVSNAVTAVVLIPALLLGASQLSARRPKISSRRVLEAALLGACTVATGVIVFDQMPAGPGDSPPLLYLTIPPLIWAALRFGLAGISIAMLIITFQAIWGTMHGHGPFRTQTPAENALSLQLFILVTTTFLMLLAVVIEEERRSKEALRESKEQMDLAAEAANAAMWAWDISADDLWITEQGRSLFGFKRDARINLAAIIERVHPEDRARREIALRRALETRGEYDMEYRLLEPGGGVRWIHARGRCVEPDDGAGLKLCGVSMDVTARKEAEASAAQKRAELEHVARVATLGELTATLTHELRQPLGVIALNYSIGMRLLDASVPDLKGTREALLEIGETTKRAGEMIQGMRDMLRRETPGVTAVDLNQSIHIVEGIVHSDAVRHAITVDLDLSPGVLSVKGDRVQLQQVLLNLMLNAIDAMTGAERNRRRRLVVRTKVMDRTSALVEVQDSGIGISPGKLEAIFDPFTTTKRDGLGMGLSICRSIIEHHGGRIWAANNPDCGATFSIKLPAALECPNIHPSETDTGKVSCSKPRP